jgi:lipoate-protein ligase A
MAAPRGRVRFQEREAARFARAVRKAGGGRITLDPRTGTYTVVINGGDGGDDDDDATEWNAATAKLQTRR